MIILAHERDSLCFKKCVSPSFYFFARLFLFYHVFRMRCFTILLYRDYNKWRGSYVMLTSYYTIKSDGSHEIVINKSRFITHMKRTTTEEEAQSFIEAIKKEHWNATHNCSAYLIGENDDIQKANDDGEPSGTAGIPMLEVLKKRQLKDTCAVVTRYFGGIKLGAGGLIRAYGNAVNETIDVIGVVERQLIQIVHVTVDYHWLGKVENELRNSSYLLQDTMYEENVTFSVGIPIKKTDSFVQWITNITNGQLQINKKETTYIEVNVK